jgi:deoxyadenosine/deoxycytidine kinase
MPCNQVQILVHNTHFLHHPQDYHRKMLSPQKLPLSAKENFSPAKHYERDTKKYDSVFGDSKGNYRCEYDQQSGNLDFFSRKMAPSRKCFERVITFKPKDNGSFQFISAYYDGSEVSEEWVCEKLSAAAGKCLAATFNDENENTALSQEEVAVITPDEHMVTNKKRKSTFYDLSKLLNVSTRELACFLPTYFSVNLDAAVERAGLMTNKEAEKSNASTFSIKPLLISIEGNIGAGKSYLLTALRKAHPEWCFIDEPVEFWESLKNDNKESLLEVFYKDQRRWSYTFQNCALLSRFNNIETTITDFATNASAKFAKEQATLPACERATGALRPVPQIFITERCLDTDHEVFAKMLHADGQLDNLEFDLYERWFSLLGKSATPLSAIVYVDTVPTLCADRINIRSRDGEGSIPLAYLKSLDSFQRNWIDSTNVPTVRTLSDNLQAVEDFVSELIEKAASTPTMLLQ